jgi:hypothetical protein
MIILFSLEGSLLISMETELPFYYADGNYIVLICDLILSSGLSGV